MSLIDIILTVVIIVLATSAILVLYRFIKGPTLPDRVSAIDLITTIAIAIIVVFSLLWDSPNFFDVAMVLALISFFGLNVVCVLSN